MENQKLNPESDILKFLSSPEVVEFIQSSDALIRNSVTEISAACEIIASNSNGNDNSAYLNSIINSCRNILKEAAITTLLSASGAAESNNSVDFDVFFREFINGCRSTLSDKIKITSRCESNCIVKGEKPLLLYFMLGIVRKLLSVAGNESVLDMTASLSQQHLVITFKIKGTKIAKTHHDNSSYFDESVIQLMAQKLSAECKISDTTAEVSLEILSGSSFNELRSDKVILSDGLFSPYNIMLGNAALSSEYIDIP